MTRDNIILKIIAKYRVRSEVEYSKYFQVSSTEESRKIYEP